jgi:t-SNARE complex subunit (syntaxin)
LIGGGAAAAEDDAQAAARAENARKLTEEVQRCFCLCIIIIIIFIVFNHTALFLLQIKRSKPLFGSKGLLITKVSPSPS